MADTFEHFEEQERSWSVLQTLRKKLAGKAAERLQKAPWEALAGIIVESGAPEIRKPLASPPPEWRALGVDYADVVERAVIWSILMGNGGEQALSWLLEQATEDRLPILVCTRHGFRMLLEDLPS